MQVRANSLQELVYKQGQAGVTKATVSIVFNNSDKANGPVEYQHLDQITVTRQVWHPALPSALSASLGQVMCHVMLSHEQQAPLFPRLHPLDELDDPMIFNTVVKNKALLAGSKALCQAANVLAAHTPVFAAAKPMTGIMQ